LPEERLPSEPSFNEPDWEDPRESPEPEEAEESQAVSVVVGTKLTGPIDTACVGGKVVEAPEKQIAVARTIARNISTVQVPFLL